MSLLFVNELVNILIFIYNFFVNKDNIDKKTLNLIYYINIKLKGLRDILKTVLWDICVNNLNEDKLII